jgi:hypothetical protein
MVYVFDNNDIDKVKTFEKGDSARSFVFNELSADVKELFDELI